MVLDGTTDNVEGPPTSGPGELDPAVVDFLEFYLLNYFKPARRDYSKNRKGQRLLEEGRHARLACHVPATF